MIPPRSPRHVVIDASVLIGLCAREADKYVSSLMALQHSIVHGDEFYAPSLIVMEAVYVLCRKLQDGVLTQAEHGLAITNLQAALSMVKPPPHGDASLIVRAEQIRHGYGCSRSADSLYIALAEALTALGPTELLTFDSGQQTQAAAMAPTVNVNLLVP